MKTRMMIAALFAVVAVVAGCEKNVEQVQEPEKSVCLEVRIPFSSTKVEGTDEENAVGSLQVFVFDSEGYIEAYGQGTSSTLSLSCIAGSKDIVALVNAQPLSDVKSLDDLMERKSYLTDNQTGSFVMEGHLPYTLTASSAVEIPVVRIAARVVVSEVAVDFELEQHKNMDFVLKDIYLLNVAGDRTYLNVSVPEKWHNKMKKDPEAPTLAAASLTETLVTESSPYDETHYLYCYPNSVTEDTSGGEWSPRFTRLVVEAELGGRMYYYPVSFDKGLKSNTSYDVKLTITKPGSSSPDDPVDNVAASFNVEVQPWADGTAVNETI